MGSTAKKDRKSGVCIEGKTSPPVLVWNVCFVIYARKCFLGSSWKCNIERFKLFPRFDCL